MLDAIGVVERAEREDRELRLALLSSGRVSDLGELFDEFKDVVDDDEADFAEAVDANGEAVPVKYDFSKSERTRSQEEIEKEISEMLEMASTGRNTFEGPTTFTDWV